MNMLKVIFNKMKKKYLKTIVVVGSAIVGGVIGISLLMNKIFVMTPNLKWINYVLGSVVLLGTLIGAYEALK